MSLYLLFSANPGRCPCAREQTAPRQRRAWWWSWPSSGAQLLDVAGPVQTFASANEIANKIAKGAHGAPYRVVVVSRRGGPVTTTSGLPLVTRPLARTLGKARIDTLIIPGGGGVQNAVKEAAHGRVGAPPGGIGSPHRVGLHRRVPARRSRRARRPARHDALAILRPAGAAVPRHPSRRRSDLCPRRADLDLGRHHRRHRSELGFGAGRSRPQSRDGRGAPSRGLSQPARRPIAVFRAARSAGRGSRRQCAQSFCPAARLDRRECRRRFARRAARRSRPA